MINALLAIAAAAVCTAAIAEPGTLTIGAADIEAGAFEGCSDIARAELAEGVSALGDAAFRGCAKLNRVTLPSTLASIGAHCFDGCAEALYLVCPPDGPAADWAAASGFDYTAGSVCRALIVGQSYTGTDRALYGPINDARAMAFCLRRMAERPYAVTQRSNLTADEILDEIAWTFGDAGAHDISLFFFAGHGEEDGALVGGDLGMLSPARLRAALDAVPGRKVVIVDACFSGALLQDRSGESGGFAAAFTDAFRLRARSAFGGADRYYVITAAHADEYTAEALIRSGGSSRIMGYFTYALCMGLGWDGVAYQETALAADINGDGAATLEEAFAYADALAHSYNPTQSAVVYPENHTAFAPFRK